MSRLIPTLLPPPALVHALLAVLRLTEPAGARVDPVGDRGRMVTTVDAMLPAAACGLLQQMLEQAHWMPADDQGSCTATDAGDAPACWCAVWHTQPLAKALWLRLMPYLPEVLHRRQAGLDAAFEAWRPVGLSPVLRFVRYPQGGRLAPHMDPRCIEMEGRSLMSVAVQLQCARQGGRTRFLPATDGRPLLVPELAAGDALVFDHAVLHDEEEVRQGERLVLRVDVLFERMPG